MIFVLISIMEIVLPSNNMKKYIDMVTGLLVIIVIITPFVKLFNKDFQLDKKVFINTMEQVKLEKKNDIELASLHEEQIKDMYINKLKDEIRGLVHEATEYRVSEIRISIYEGEDNYGEIKDIHIVLDDDNMEKLPKDSIPAVGIEEIRIDGEVKESAELHELENSNEIIDAIYKNYNISKENIRVFLNTPREGEKGG
ncbi:hypothetical protein C3E89_12900 [Clostridium sp. Cult1]|nr:hypothetical protein [Clostridium sp. Cult1]